MKYALWIVVATACGSSAPPAAKPAPAPAPAAPAAAPEPTSDAPPLDQDLPRLVMRALAQQQAVGAAFAASGSDCTAATAKLVEIRAQYADVNRANAKILREHRAKELRAALAAHDTEFDAAAKAIMQASTMTDCAHDKAFARAIDDVLGES